MKKVIEKFFLGAYKTKEDSGYFLDNEQEFLLVYCLENIRNDDSFLLSYLPLPRFYPQSLILQMTNTSLSHLLSKFESGASIPPLVLSDEAVVSTINSLKNTHFLDLFEMRKEYIDGVFFFENETGTIKIERTRGIIEQSSKKSGSRYDIFIIERIDTLTLAAANSLLKLFEDVPSNILILLTSDSGRDAMIETLASRVIFISSNTQHITLDAGIREKIDTYFDAGDQAPFLSFLVSAKLEKSEYLGILIALKDRVLSGHIKNPDTIQKIESGIITLSSTNANARWVVDEVVLGM